MNTVFNDSVINIWTKIQGSVNPRTNEQFTQPNAYAIGVAKWKEEHNGQSPIKEANDWRVIEFNMPISEAVRERKDFMIRGTAINETTTRNGITYLSEELEPAAASFRNKPILKDHEARIENIVGRTTENVNFDAISKSIKFEARIVDEKVQSMIEKGLVTDVSIGAKVEDIEETEDGELIARGLEGLEISLVAVPGDAKANINTAMRESFEKKKEELQLLEDFNLITKLEKEDNMEIDKKITKEKTDELSVIEAKIEERILKLKELDLAEVDKKIALKEAKVKEDAEAEAAAKKAEEEKAEAEAKAKEAENDDTLVDVKDSDKKAIEDETKGSVDGEEDKSDDIDENLVLEDAETGKGFALYREYSRDTSGKLKRLVRT